MGRGGGREGLWGQEGAALSLEMLGGPPWAGGHGGAGGGSEILGVQQLASAHLTKWRE